MHVPYQIHVLARAFTSQGVHAAPAAPLIQDCNDVAMRCSNNVAR
jgi:hypothetical protein